MVSPEEEPRALRLHSKAYTVLRGQDEEPILSSGLVDMIDIGPVALIAQSGLGWQLPAATPQLSFTQAW